MATNEMMLNGQLRNTCEQCGKAVEVFNQDVAFSMELHMQSHKSLESVAAMLNQPDNVKQSHTNSRALDEIFKHAPKSIRSHKDFILINKMSKAVCSVCNLIVHEYSKVIHHLKSVNHERKVIAFLKQLIPSKKLQESLNLVSFQTSNFSCSLCECEIKMNSANMFETIVNIFLHNSLPEHIGLIGNRQKPDEEKKDISVVTSTPLNKSANKENKSSVKSSTLLIMFKCLRCDYQIEYDVVLNNKSDCDEESLRNNIKSFVCKGFEISHLDEMSAHKCVALNSKIFCIVCQIEMDIPSIDQLISHALGADQLKSDVLQSNLTKQMANVTMSSSGCVEPTGNEIAPNRVITLSVLLNSLPENLRHVKDISQTEEGFIFCKICIRRLPPTGLCLETHLKGNSHKKKLLKSVRKKLPQYLLNETCMSVNGDLNIQCSICNCTIQPDVLCLEEHMNGHDHKKKAQRILLPQELHHLDCVILKELEILTCTLCKCHVKKSSIKQHLVQNIHKKNLFLSLMSSIPSNCENVSFISSITITNLSEILCSICKVTIGIQFSDLRHHFENNHSNLITIKEQSLCHAPSDNENDSLMLPTDNNNELVCSICMVKLNVNTKLVEHFEGIKHKKHVKRLSVTKPEDILK